MDGEIKNRRILVDNGEVVNYNGYDQYQKDWKEAFKNVSLQPMERIPLQERVKVGIILEKDAIMPDYANIHDSGADVYCKKDEVVPANARGYIIKTGVKLDLPYGYGVAIRPKSGVSVRTNLRVILGTIDQGYKGEIGIMVDNLGSDPITIPRGKSVAQMILERIPRMDFMAVEELSDSDRGDGGFGSSDRGIGETPRSNRALHGMYR